MAVEEFDDRFAAVNFSTPGDGASDADNVYGERRKSDPGKLALAARLRRERTLTMGWIAGRLQMGTRKSAIAKLHRRGKETRDDNSNPAKTMV